MKYLHKKALLIIALLSALVLAGCSQQSGQDSAGGAVETATSTPVIVVATPTPQPAPSPEPTPSLPAYAVNAVSLSGDPIIIEDIFGQDTLLWFWAPW